MDLLNDKWETTDEPGELKSGNIDLWRVNLNCNDEYVRSVFEILSPDEKQRADRYRFEKDRRQFAVCRGILKRIIGGYLSVYPQAVQFSYNPFGKPYLTDSNSCFRFNVSHSHGVGIVAISTNKEIGVDIELIDDKVDVFSVAEGAFSAPDVSLLKSLPSKLHSAAFFAGWTRKEACLKAIGDGLSTSEEQQSVIPSIIEERDVMFSTCIDNRITHWSLTSIKTTDQFKAALAVEGEIGKVRYRQFGDS